MCDLLIREKYNSETIDYYNIHYMVWSVIGNNQRPNITLSFSVTGKGDSRINEISDETFVS